MSYKDFRGTNDGESKEILFAHDYVTITELNTNRTVKDVKMATNHQNIHEHWDVMIDKVKYDVKSRKRLSRASQKQDKLLWIELKNNIGNPGWLFSDISKAFELEDGWGIISGKRLMDHVQKNLIKEYDKEPYKLYKRKYKDQDNLLTLVPINDVIWDEYLTT